MAKISGTSAGATKQWYHTYNITMWEGGGREERVDTEAEKQEHDIESTLVP